MVGRMMSKNHECCESAISEALGDLQARVDGLESSVAIIDGKITHEEVTANEDGSITSLRTVTDSDGLRWCVTFTRQPNLHDIKLFDIRRMA